MEKRTFLKNLVLGGPSVLLGPALLANRQDTEYPRYEYGRPGSLNEVISRENQLCPGLTWAGSVVPCPGRMFQEGVSGAHPGLLGFGRWLPGSTRNITNKFFENHA
jgi:hypothetical protein